MNFHDVIKSDKSKLYSSRGYILFHNLLLDYVIRLFIKSKNLSDECSSYCNIHSCSQFTFVLDLHISDFVDFLFEGFSEV